MPELPEVETTVRALRPFLVGHVITDFCTQWPRHIGTPSLPEFRHRIRNKQIQLIDRRAKYLLFELSDGETLIIHLKMSGRLTVTDNSTPLSKHDHTIFYLNNGTELRFWDMRKFGRVYLVADPAEILSKLGPEPLTDAFTVELLRDRLDGRSRALKPLLLDQTFIAGVGNIYADESLHHARLHPARTADTLTPAEIAALRDGIQQSLRLGIEREGASIDLYIKPDGSKGDMQNAVSVFRRTGNPCFTCGTPIERIVMGGRSTHFCPNCQKLRSVDPNE